MDDVSGYAWQLISAAVLRYLLLESTAELILSNNTLLVFPMLIFEGFNNLYDTRLEEFDF